MQINLSTKYANEPAELVWGEYRNGAPFPEIAIRITSLSGEPLLTATRSLAEYGVCPGPGLVILHVNGANEGVAECFEEQDVILPDGMIIPVGDELFYLAQLTPRAAADLSLHRDPITGPAN